MKLPDYPVIICSAPFLLSKVTNNILLRNMKKWFR